MSSVVFLPPSEVRRRLAAAETITYYAPRVARAPREWGGAADVLGALGATLIGLIVVALVWAPIIYAGVWLCRRLHHH